MFCYRATTGGAHGLLLAVLSDHFRDGTGTGHMQDKGSNSCTISLALREESLYFWFWSYTKGRYSWPWAQGSLLEVLKEPYVVSEMEHSFGCMQGKCLIIFLVQEEPFF